MQRERTGTDALELMHPSALELMRWSALELMHRSLAQEPKTLECTGTDTLGRARTACNRTDALDCTGTDAPEPCAGNEPIGADAPEPCATGVRWN